VWTQFICPSYILTEAGDVHGLSTHWKLTDNLHLINVNNPGFLSELLKQIITEKTYTVNNIIAEPTLDRFGSIVKTPTGFKVY
jgi:hypothetical protein